MTGHERRRLGLDPDLRLPAGLVLSAVLLVTSCATGSRTDDGAASSTGAASTTSVTAPGPGGVDEPTGASAHAVTTVVISDAAAGAPTWPQLLADRLAAAGSPLDADVVVGRGGFAPEDPADSSFAELVTEEVEPSTQLVVFRQTWTGAGRAADVAEGMGEAFGAVEAAAPDALIVLVAPSGATADAPAPAQADRDAIRSAAEGAEVAVTYVDPVTEGWSNVTDPARTADALFPHVAPLVAALANSGAFD
ncbi:MAG: hypothetical protein JWR85_3768 [Marmoricola sp.]|nr:hypothetical protein [Marmoricola sp.]